MIFSDSPEVHIDQQWAQDDKRIKVKIDCIVHGNPVPQVRQDQEKSKAVVMKQNSQRTILISNAGDLVPQFLKDIRD